jgi:hypothetical protein
MEHANINLELVVQESEKGVKDPTNSVAVRGAYLELEIAARKVIAARFEQEQKKEVKDGTHIRL